jgi:hypothetical protein
LRVLFVSGSLGLGHVTRDLAIAVELRRREPSLEILWFAGPPASGYLRASGERLVEEAAHHADDTGYAERIAGEFGANIARYTLSATLAWARDALLALRAARTHRCDLVLGDEAYESAILYSLLPRRLRPPFVNIYDFLGLDAASDGLGEQALVSIYNLVWAFCNRRLKAGEAMRSLFVGEPEDIPQRALGPLLPNRRREAERYYRFVGYVLPFDAGQQDRSRLRAELGYGGCSSCAGRRSRSCGGACRRSGWSWSADPGSTRPACASPTRWSGAALCRTSTSTLPPATSPSCKAAGRRPWS